MVELFSFVHYLCVILLIVVPAVCVGRAQGSAAQAALEAINKQPGAYRHINLAYLFGSALTETASLLSMIFGYFLLITVSTATLTLPLVIGEFGLTIALTSAASSVAWMSSAPLSASLGSIAKQPFEGTKIVTLMGIVLSMFQISVIMALVLDITLGLLQLNAQLSLIDGVKIGLAGLTFGIGVIGPLKGMSKFSSAVCMVIGNYPNSYSVIASFVFMSQALIETPILFVMGMSTFMIWSSSQSIIAYCAAGIAIACSTIGPGIASGEVAAQACWGIAQYPENASLFSYTSIVAQAFIDASVIYALMIAATCLLLS